MLLKGLLGTRFARGTLVAIFDQALLSGVNFLIAITLIRLGSKVEYGLYVQLFAVLLLSMSLQNAAINTPLVALGPKRSQADMNLLVMHLLWLQLIVVMALMLLASLGLWIFVLELDMPGLDTHLIAPFAFWLGASWLREYMRGYRFLQHAPHRVLLLDLGFAAVMLSLLGWFWYSGSADLELLLWGLGVGNLLAGLISYSRSRLAALPPWGRLRESLADTWELARWGLPGVVTTWGFVNTYVYIASAIEGAEKVAELSAARLLLMPVGMTVIAWSRVYQPRASAWMGEGEAAKVSRAILLSALGLIGLALVYVITLLLGYDLLETWVLGDDYAGLEAVVILWGLYFALNGLRMTGSATLVAAGYFKWLFYYAVVAIVVLIPSSIVLTMLFGISGTVIGSIITEVLLIVIIFRHGVAHLKGELRNHGPR